MRAATADLLTTETVVIGGKRISVDDDGLWMGAFDAVAKELWPHAVAFS